MYRLFKELEYLKQHQGKVQNNFEMVGMGYVVDVLNRYEKEIKGLELINEMKPSSSSLKVKIEELEKKLLRAEIDRGQWVSDYAAKASELVQAESELKECIKTRLNHIGTINSLEAQLEMATATLVKTNRELTEAKTNLSKLEGFTGVLITSTGFHESETKLKALIDLLNEAAPIMEKHYLRTKWFDAVNELNK